MSGTVDRIDQGGRGSPTVFALAVFPSGLFAAAMAGQSQFLRLNNRNRVPAMISMMATDAMNPEFSPNPG